MVVRGSGGGHSASVSIVVRQNGRTIPLSQVGAGRLYFENAVTLAAGLAELERVVDGQVRRWMIRVQPEPRPADLITFEFCE